METIKKIQTEIDQLEATLEPASRELDRLYVEFSKALVPEVEIWMQRHVKRLIEDNAQQINARGVEAVRSIKVDLAALVARLDRICSEAAGEQSQWPHRRDPGSHVDRDRKSSMSDAAAVFRRAINELGPLLEKHELLTVRKGHVSEWEKSGGRYGYSFNPGFDEQNFPVLQEYNRKHEEQKALIAQLESKRLDLEKAKARELWDEA